MCSRSHYRFWISPPHLIFPPLPHIVNSGRQQLNRRVAPRDCLLQDQRSPSIKSQAIWQIFSWRDKITGNGCGQTTGCGRSPRICILLSPPSSIAHPTGEVTVNLVPRDDCSLAVTHLSANSSSIQQKIIRGGQIITGYYLHNKANRRYTHRP